MEADNGSWHSPLLRTALLLAGDPERAERLAASAVRTRGDKPDAYFTLYRRFLSPLRRWSRPAWAGSLSRREVAIVVAAVHDGWPEEDVADLVDRSPDRVQQVLDGQSFSTEALRELAGTPDGSRISTRLVVKEQWSTLYLAAAGMAIVAVLGVVLVLLPWEERAAAPKWPMPTPAYTPPADPDLPLTLKSPLTMGYWLNDVHDEYEPENLWHVVDTAGTRWVVRDASPEDAVPQISPDGRKIVYTSVQRAGPVVADLATGKVVPVGGATDTPSAFSLDGRFLARWIETEEDDEEPHVEIIDLDRPKSPKVFGNASFGGWTRKGAVLITKDETLLVRRGGSTVRVSSFGSRNPVRVSVDGKLAAEAITDEFDDEKNELAIVDLPSGKTVRKTDLPKDTNVTLHRWVTPTSILVELQGHGDGGRSGSLHLLDTRTGTFTLLKAEVWHETPRAVGVIQPLR